LTAVLDVNSKLVFTFFERITKFWGFLSFERFREFEGISELFKISLLKALKI
jgi:hypothetical protein